MTIFSVFSVKYHAPFKSFEAAERYACVIKIAVTVFTIMAT